MKKLLLASTALLLMPTIAFAQCNGIFGPNTLCGNLGASPAPPSAFPASGTVVGPASSTVGDAAVWDNTGGTKLADAGFPPVLGSGSPTANQIPAYSGTGQQTQPKALVALINTVCAISAIRPTCVTLFGYANIVWWGAATGTDSTTAINNALSFMDSTYGGGQVVVPCGNFTISAIITLNHQWLGGYGEACSELNASASELNPAVRLSGDYSQLFGLSVVGDTAGTATGSLVIAEAKHNVFRNCQIWGGNAALQLNLAHDYRINDCFIGPGTSANSVALLSVGSNGFSKGAWFDPPGAGPMGYSVIIEQSASWGGGSMENHFTDCDMSGATTDALLIDDSAFVANHTATTTIVGGVLGGPTSVSKALLTAITGTEVGGNITLGAAPGSVVMSADIGTSNVTATGAICDASVVNITCTASWGAWTPVISCGTGTITTLGTVTARYRRSTATTTQFYISITITTNGTCAVTVNATLPTVAAATVNQTATGRENALTGKVIGGNIGANSSNMLIGFYDGTYPGGSGAVLLLSGTYESQ